MKQGHSLVYTKLRNTVEPWRCEKILLFSDIVIKRKILSSYKGQNEALLTTQDDLQA